uniref:hypothetical protein n=1 Tax=Nocardia gipuzkoensis TaxID=2749991 RepID=UPI0015EFB4CF
SNSQRAPEAKIRVPKIRDIRSDGYGMTIDFAPLPKVGSDEFAQRGDGDGFFTDAQAQAMGEVGADSSRDRVGGRLLGGDDEV